MTLIKSISGIRGTIGGIPGSNLTPLDIVKFTSGYGYFLISANGKNKLKVVVGRDARISGEMVNYLVCGTLMGLGIDVVNLGLASTPTVEIAVEGEKADGGIILTASHNPKQWNALKLLNDKGEFLSADDGAKILDIAESDAYKFADVEALGSMFYLSDYNKIHIKKVKSYPLVDLKAIKSAGFKVVIDCVNSVGGILLPDLLKALGVQEVIELYCDPTGRFPHNPEPLPEHLSAISEKVVEAGADLGFVVDPDVDRLAIINEDGSMFGEEYTLVAVADYVLQNKPGATVSNLSSTKALMDITEKHGQNYYASAVGEVNVVDTMKKYNAVIGGEGNGGVIVPDFHYGRDALIGIALFLTSLAKKKMKCSELRAKFPDYTISKNKIELEGHINVDDVLNKIKELYMDHEIIDIDGVKIYFKDGWVHLRKSNTEPIIRIYAESNSVVAADNLANKIISEIKSLT